MDYVEGEDLQEKLDRAGKPLPEAQALDWIGQVCAALDYLHSQKPPVVPRDLKPAIPTIYMREMPSLDHPIARSMRAANSVSSWLIVYPMTF